MTAASQAIVNGRPPRQSLKSVSSGAVSFAIVDHTPATSYASGGDACDFSSIGAIGKQPTHVITDNPSGYVAQYDRTNKKMLMYQQSAATGALTEASGDLHAAVVRCLVIF